MEDGTDKISCHSSKEKGGSKNASRASGSEGQRRAEDLGKNENKRQPEPQLALQAGIHGFIADAEYLRKPNSDGSDEQTSDGWFDNRMDA